MENLEERRLLAAEGQLFAATATVDTSGLVGDLTAIARWGDGTQSAATIDAAPTRGALRARIDYSLDSSNFFNSSVRRQLLQLAADTWVSAFADNLTAIVPGGGNTWTAVLSHPATGAVHQIKDLTIQQNEIVIYAGARNLPSPQLGLGGFGGFSSLGTPSFNETVAMRGQASATTDFGPWGGSIAFDSGVNWYFGTDPAGLQQGQNDFLTVAMHEIAHLLGFGTSASWKSLISGTSFTGPRSVAAYDGSGNVPLSSGTGHWAFDLEDAGRETLMDPNVQTGTRKTPTPLDFAGFADLGWQLIARRAEVSADHVYADNGLFPVELVVAGSAGQEAINAIAASISNVPPVLEVVDEQRVNVGQPLQVSNIGALSDPGFPNPAANPPTVETFTYTINWGDGSAIDTGSATIDRIGSKSQSTLASFDGGHTYDSAGTFEVTVSVRDDDGGTDTETFSVVVEAPPSLSLTVTANDFFEDDPAGVSELVVRRHGATSGPLTVALQSDDTSEVQLQANVSFLAGEVEKRVPLTPVDDTELDGDISVTLRASAANVAEETVLVTVKDAERLSAELNLDLVGEGSGSAAAELLVRRSNTDTQNPLQVEVTGLDPSEIELTTPIVIPQGKQEVVVLLDVVDDTIQDGYQDVLFRFTAPGYADATTQITVADNEPSPYQQDDDALDVDGDGSVDPLDALKIINELNRSGGARRLVPGQDPTGQVFYDVNGDYLITPIDALAVINFLNRFPAVGEIAATNRDDQRGLLVDAALDQLLPDLYDDGANG